jgi:hypothetical protein
MRQRSTRSPFLAIVARVAALALVGCGGDNDQPCPGVVEGATYRIEVVEESKTSQPAGCAAEWGFTDNLKFTATANEVVPSATCSVAVPELSGVPGWTFELRSTEPRNDGFMWGTYDGMFGDCEATLTMSLDAGDDHRCFASGGATSADCLLLFNFSNGGRHGCPTNCTAWLSADVTRQ